MLIKTRKLIHSIYQFPHFYLPLKFFQNFNSIKIQIIFSVPKIVIFVIMAVAYIQSLTQRFIKHIIFLGFMSWVKAVASLLPEIKGPTEKKLPIDTKLKWTFAVLVAYFILYNIPLFGLGVDRLQQLEMISMIFGTNFGSIISLGIGPIVTSSIILQLLAGSGLLKIDRSTHEGRQEFQSLQKIMAVFFIVFEAMLYVLLKGLAPAESVVGGARVILNSALILQLILGGFLILFLDEIAQKYGIGSGISLFIAAGVSNVIFIKTFSWISSGQYASGHLIAFFQALAQNDAAVMYQSIVPIIATLVVFVLAVYAQAMKVEIPLSFERIRGHGARWPLSFLYTSNIPVILIASLFANIQVVSQLRGLENSIFFAWLSAPNAFSSIIIKGTGFSWMVIANAAIYFAIMMAGCVLFGLLWVQSAGMDPGSVAQQIIGSGLQLPGFRRDKRVLERVLSRYVWPLAVMGSIAVGFLAASADLTGALGRGTGILLTVMIIYKFYETIAKEQLSALNPMLRKFLE